MLGWYLTNDSDSNSVKPVQKTDLYDIYLVDTSTIEGITVDVVQSDYAENSTLSASYIQNRPYFTETFDELNSRYFPHSVGTADIGLSFMRFDNITISLVDAQPYVVTINLDGESCTGTAVATTWTHNAQLVQITLDDNDYVALYLILNGDFIGTRLSYIPNTVVVLGEDISSVSELSISITGLEFKYVKQMPKDSLPLPQYRYVTYPSNLCKFIAEADTQNPTQVHIYAVVPVCVESSLTNYYISNGIRAGYINITPHPNITINSDLYAKDQNWEVWTINMGDEDSKLCWGMDKVVATTLLDEAIAPHVNAVMSCKTYTIQSFDETLPVAIWAGNLVTVCMDTEESAKNLVTSIAEGPLLKDVTITVRLQDISYTEEVAKVTTSPEGVIPVNSYDLATPVPEGSPTKPNEDELVKQLINNLKKSHNSGV